jgi:aminoglycoside phosphotransferase (APT) family kinase protein
MWDRAAVPLARFLRTLHALPAPSVPLPDDDLGRLDLATRVPSYLEMAEEVVRRGLWPRLDALTALVEALPDTGAVAPAAVIVHGDLNFRNVLVGADGQVTGVLDWGDIHRGGRAEDLAFAAGYFGPAGRDAFRTAYGGGITEAEWILARFRGTWQCLSILLRAATLGDRAEAAECVATLQRLTTEPP